jgi:hypothetical protein
MSITMIKRIGAILCFGLALSIPVFSQESLPDSGSDSEDALFGEEVVDNAPLKDPGNGVSAALKSDKVRIGGYFTGSMGLSWKWNNPWVDGFDPLRPDSTSVSPTLSSLVFFDARPDEDFRVYGSVKTAWPFTSTSTFLSSATLIEEPRKLVTTSGSITLPNISVFELFSDFTWKDSVFFRFGKSTVKWGTGYFWSPADVINVGAIDYADPTAQREGPVNFRVHLPILGTQNNLYAYAILKPQDQKNPLPVAPSDIALAAKAEALVRHYELGLGGYYQYGKPERGMLTLAGPLGNFDIFGELSVAHGSEKTFVTDIVSAAPPKYFSITSHTDASSLFVSGTAGLSYNSSKDNIFGLLQYYYNGEGYADAERKSLISKGFALMDLYPEPIKSTIGYSLAGLATGTGRHYAGLSLSKAEFLNENLTVSILSIANLSDLSGLVRPAIVWKLFDRMSLQADLTFFFGGKESEYGILGQGNPVSVGISAKLGTGAF